jgi:hypothetical protein
MRSPFSDRPRPALTAAPSVPRPRLSRRAGQIRNLAAGLVALLFLVDLAALLVGLSWISAVDPLPAESLGPDQSATVFYDATGAEVLRLSDTENRLWVSWDKIPQALKDAFVSIEDERFWTHSGVDWRRIVNAAIGLVTGDSRAGGGSTITQQLVKNITGKTDHSIKRKLQEQWAAIDLERRLSKQRILELYLNIIYLGNGAYGVQAAARGYFGKDVSERAWPRPPSSPASPRTPAATAAPCRPASTASGWCCARCSSWRRSATPTTRRPRPRPSASTAAKCCCGWAPTPGSSTRPSRTSSPTWWRPIAGPSRWPRPSSSTAA